MPTRKKTLETTNGKLNIPVVINGQKLNTEQCAAFAHQVLRDAGYLAQGNAWNSNGHDVVFSGYDTLTRPEQYDSLAVLKYNDAASDRVYKDFDSKTLDKSQPYLVNMYYKSSPYLKEAFETGTKGRTGTHTGYLIHNGKDWEVVHNIHGKAKVDKFTKIQGSGKNMELLLLWLLEKIHYLTPLKLD